MTSPSQVDIPSATESGAPSGVGNTGASPGDTRPTVIPITITLPFFFIPTRATDAGHQQGLSPEDIQRMFAQIHQINPFDVQQPAKKHATQSALDSLSPVEVETLPSDERRCTICMQDYYVKSVGPRSPYVEDVRDEDVSRGLLPMTDIQGVEDAVPQEHQGEGEKPLRMPCGHIFGSSCLKEWLYQSPTCPLCRLELESYTEEPQTPPTDVPPIGGHFVFLGPPPLFPQAPPASGDQQQTDQMQFDTSTTENTTPEDTTPEPTSPNLGPQFTRLEFQFIITPPPPTNSRSTTSTPPPRSTANTPRASYIRHHPYARTPTPSPLSGPSVTDRPDLFCAQRASGLCDHDITDEALIRLECGHAFHGDCLESAMATAGYPTDLEARRCPRCRRWMNVLQ